MYVSFKECKCHPLKYKYVNLNKGSFYKYFMLMFSKYFEFHKAHNMSIIQRAQTIPTSESL